MSFFVTSKVIQTLLFYRSYSLCIHIIYIYIDIRIFSMVTYRSIPRSLVAVINLSFNGNF